MRGRVPRIHDFGYPERTWMAGSRPAAGPAMTKKKSGCSCSHAIAFPQTGRHLGQGAALAL